METKRCTKCGEEKELILFTPDKRRKDGRTSICKECCRTRRRSYYEKYYLDNKEKKKLATREWYLTNREYALARNREHQQIPEVKQKNRDRQRKKYHEGLDRKNYLKRYNNENADRIREIKRLSFRRNLDKNLTRKKKDRDVLNTPYIKERLRYQYGITDKVTSSNPLIIELKRLELKAKRYVKQNKQ